MDRPPDNWQEYLQAGLHPFSLVRSQQFEASVGGNEPAPIEQQTKERHVRQEGDSVEERRDTSRGSESVATDLTTRASNAQEAPSSSWQQNEYPSASSWGNPPNQGTASASVQNPAYGMDQEPPQKKVKNSEQYGSIYPGSLNLPNGSTHESQRLLSQGSDVRSLPSFALSSSSKQPALPSFSSMFWPPATSKPAGLPPFQDFTKSTPDQFQNPLPLLSNWNMFNPVQENRFDTSSPRFSPWGFNGYPLSLTPNSGKSSPAQATDQPTYLDSSSSASSMSDLRANADVSGETQPGFPQSTSSKKKHKSKKSKTHSPKSKTVKDLLLDRLDDTSKASGSSPPAPAPGPGPEMEPGQVYPNTSAIPQPVLPETRHYQMPTEEGLGSVQSQPLAGMRESEMPPGPGMLSMGGQPPQGMMATDLSKYSTEKKKKKSKSNNGKGKDATIDSFKPDQQNILPQPSYSNIMSPSVVSYAPKPVLPSPQPPAHTSSSGDMLALPTYSESSMTSSRPASTASFASLDSNLSQTLNPDAVKKAQAQVEQEFKELDRDTERDILRRIFSCQSLELCDPKSIASRPKTTTNLDPSSMHINQEMMSPNQKPKKKKRSKKPKEGQPPSAPFILSQCPVPSVSSAGLTPTSDQLHVHGETVLSNTAWQPAAVVSPSTSTVPSLSPAMSVESRISSTSADTHTEPLKLDTKPSTIPSNGSSGDSLRTSSTVPVPISQAGWSTSTSSHADSVPKPSVENPQPNVISYEHLKNCMTPEQLMVSAYSKDLYERIQKHILQTRDVRITSDVQAQTKDSMPSPKNGKPSGDIQGYNDPSHKTSQFNSNSSPSPKNLMPGPDFNQQFLDFVGKSNPAHSKGNRPNSGGVLYARESSPKIPMDNIRPEASHLEKKAKANNKVQKVYNSSGDSNSLDKLLAFSKILPSAPDDSAMAKLDRVISSVDIGDGPQSSHLGRLTDFNGTCNSSFSSGDLPLKPVEQRPASVPSQPLVSNVQKNSSPKVERRQSQTLAPALVPPPVMKAESDIKCPSHKIFIPPKPVRTPDPEITPPVSQPGQIPWPGDSLNCPPNHGNFPPPPEPNRTVDTTGLTEPKEKDPYDFDLESPPHVSHPSQIHGAYPPFSDTRRMTETQPRFSSHPHPGAYPGADAYRMPGPYPPSSQPHAPPRPPVSGPGYPNLSGSYSMEVNTGDGSEKIDMKPADFPPQAQAAFDKNLDLLQRLKTNTVEVPHCNCLKQDFGNDPAAESKHRKFNEKEQGPYYTQLGSARSIPEVREEMERRTGLKGDAIRIEKVQYSGKEGRTTQGCPVAKWIIRRSGPEEKVLTVVRERRGHFCDCAVIVVVIVAWEGVVADTADDLYNHLVRVLPNYGHETERRCGANEQKTCACQGFDPSVAGASFSFGCSWSMFFNGCKFSRSRFAKKFKLKDENEEGEIERRFQNLATDVAPVFQAMAPQAYSNQCFYEKEGGDCRIGLKPGRPFSGVTSCVDFCAHAHKDLHNMNNGCTVVLTLTKHRGFEKPEDEQLHVLPLHVLEPTDEFGSMEGQHEKIRNGSLEVLANYYTITRVRGTPRKSKKKNKNSPASAKKDKDDSSPKTPRGRKPKNMSDSSNMYFDSKAMKEKKEKKVKQEKQEKVEWDEERAVTPMGHWPGQGMPMMPMQSPNGMVYPFSAPPGYMPHPAFPFPPPFMGMHPWMGMGGFPEQGFPPGMMDQFQQKQPKKRGAPRGPRKKKVPPDVKPAPDTPMMPNSKTPADKPSRPQPEPKERSGSLSSLQEVLDNVVHSTVRDSLSQCPNSPSVGASVSKDPTLGSILKLNTPDFPPNLPGTEGDNPAMENLQSILDDVHKYVKDSLTPSPKPGSPRAPVDKETSGIAPAAQQGMPMGQNNPSIQSSMSHNHGFPNGPISQHGEVSHPEPSPRPHPESAVLPQSSERQPAELPPFASESPYPTLPGSQSLQGESGKDGMVRETTSRSAETAVENSVQSSTNCNVPISQLADGYPSSQTTATNSVPIGDKSTACPQNGETQQGSSVSSLPPAQENSTQQNVGMDITHSNGVEMSSQRSPGQIPVQAPPEQRSAPVNSDDMFNNLDHLQEILDGVHKSVQKSLVDRPMSASPKNFSPVPSPLTKEYPGRIDMGQNVSRTYPGQQEAPHSMSMAGHPMASGHPDMPGHGGMPGMPGRNGMPGEHGMSMPGPQHMSGSPTMPGPPNLSGTQDMSGSNGVSGPPNMPGQLSMSNTSNMSSSLGIPGVPNMGSSPNLSGAPNLPYSPNRSGVPGMSGSPNMPDTPNRSGVPGMAKSPDMFGAPNLQHTPSKTDIPGMTGSPNMSGAAQVPGSPSTFGSHQMSDSSGMSNLPNGPVSISGAPNKSNQPFGFPNMSGQSDMSGPPKLPRGLPNMPGLPDMSNLQGIPGAPNIPNQPGMSGPPQLPGPRPLFSSMGLPRPVMSCMSGPPVMKRDNSLGHLDDILNDVHKQVKEFVESSENERTQPELCDTMQNPRIQSNTMPNSNTPLEFDLGKPRLNSMQPQSHVNDQMHSKLEDMLKYGGGKGRLDPSIEAMASMFSNDPMKNIQKFRNEMFSGNMSDSTQQNRTLPDFQMQHNNMKSGSHVKNDHAMDTFSPNTNHQDSLRDPVKNLHDSPYSPVMNLPYPREVERLRGEVTGDQQKPSSVPTQESNNLLYKSPSPMAHHRPPSPKTPPNSAMPPMPVKPRSREHSPDSRFNANTFCMDQFQKFTPLSQSVGPRIPDHVRNKGRSPVPDFRNSEKIGHHDDQLNQLQDKMPNAENIDFFAQMANAASGSPFPGSFPPKIPLPHRMADANFEKMLPFAMPKLPSSLLSPLIPGSPGTPKPGGHDPAGTGHPTSEAASPRHRPMRQSPIPMAHSRGPRSPAGGVLPATSLQNHSAPSPAHTPKPAWQSLPGTPQPDIGEVHPSASRNPVPDQDISDWPINLTAEAVDQFRPREQSMQSRTASQSNIPHTPNRPWQEGGGDKPLDLSAERPLRHDTVTLSNPFDDYPSARQAPNKVSYERTPVMEQVHHQDKDYSNVHDLHENHHNSEPENFPRPHGVRRNDTVFVRNPFDVDMPYPPNTSCPPLSPHSKQNRQEKFARCSSDGKPEAPKQDPEFNLHLLSEAAMRADTPQPQPMGFNPQGVPIKEETNMNHSGQYPSKHCDMKYSQGGHGGVPMEQTSFQQQQQQLNHKNMNAKPSNGRAPQSDFLPSREPDGCQRDPQPPPPPPKPDREYLSDNEEVFHDNNVGGVAIALSHGSVLFEVAKRELHATTALKNPNRYKPTRISIVFYQHKNLNVMQHGWHEWEAKMESRRKEAEKRRQEMMAQGEVTPEKKDVKGKKRTKEEMEKTEEPEIEPFVPPVYRYMWDANVKHATTYTNDTVVTKWKKPQCIISGPYQKWV